MTEIQMQSCVGSLRTAISLGLFTTLAGCMELPFASWQAHEYEGELAPHAISAVEDGRRVTFAQVTVTRRQSSVYQVHPETVFVEIGTADAGADLPIWTGRQSLSDHPLLERIHNESPSYRRPQLVGQALELKPTLIPWNAGYIVATRPLTIAFRVDRVVFTTARKRASLDERTKPLAIRMSLTGGQAEDQPGATLQQYNFRVPWVEPGALSQNVDVVEVLQDAQPIRVIRLDAAMTIDELLDVLATPAGLKPHIAEEIRQQR